jgi:hypothetical protein
MSKNTAILLSILIALILFKYTPAESSLWKVLTATYDGTNYDKVRIDSATNALETIEYEHSEIHGGDHYFYQNTVTLNNGSSLVFCVRTADTTSWSHIVWDLQAQGQFTFEMYEGGTFVWGGTDLTAVNNDRNSANTNNWAYFQSDCTVTDQGTELLNFTIGSSTTPARGVPGGAARGRELILKQNEFYLWKIISGLNSNIISYQGEWYNHTNVR